MSVNKLRKELEDNLRKNSRKNKDTGKLEKSIKVTTKTDNDGIDITITMLEYGLYQKNDFIQKSIDETLTENNIIDAVLDGIDLNIEI